MVTNTKGLKPQNALLRDMKKNWQLYLMVLPVVLFFVIFAYLPLSGLVLAFKKFNFMDGIFGSPWCGFDNFKFLFASGKGWILTKNTIVYNLAFLLTSTVFEVILAIFLSELNSMRFKKITQTIMLFPHFVSMVVVGIFIYSFVNYDTGVLNNVLSSCGIDRVHVYAKPEVWPFILVGTNMWKNFGYGSIIYLATIMGFDRECYEAAEIDGANLWQRTAYITLPQLKPIVIIMVIMALGRLVKGNFELFYQLIGDNGMLLESTDIIETYVFRSVLSATELGISTATGLYQSILSFVMVISANFVVKRIESDYALF